MNIDINRAVQAIRQGGIIIYPTETFFALGGAGLDPEVARRVREIKARPVEKPLPLIAGSISQCLQFVEMDGFSLKAAGQFWPGSLSILARAGKMIPYGVKDQEGMVSIRVTPHQEAAKLCLLSGTPLIATSANFSGKPACAGYHDLDRKLVSIVGQVLDSQMIPAGGLPSTLVRVVGNGKLRIIREGRVTPAEIVQKGWEIKL